MLRQLIIIVFGVMFLLAACNSGDETKEGNEQQSSADSETTEEAIEAEEDEGEEAQEENDEIEKENPSVSDLEELFLRMKDAAQSVQSITITGVAEAENKVADTTIASTMEMHIDATFNPFVQYAIFNVTEGEGGKTEWYATENDMFVNMDDSGWERTVHPVAVTAANLIHRTDHFDHLILYKDLFELAEEGDHYIITYIGSDEQFKEVFYEDTVVQNFTQMMEELNALLENMEMSGAVEMKVSKDTFLIEEQHTIYNSSMENAGIAVETLQDGTYTYSYDEVSKIEIPDEVKGNVQN